MKSHLKVLILILAMIAAASVQSNHSASVDASHVRIERESPG